MRLLRAAKDAVVVWAFVFLLFYPAVAISTITPKWMLPRIRAWVTKVLH